ncbi:MAG: HIT domain-containing protein [Candidatus Woesearchaeota archaeon]
MQQMSEEQRKALEEKIKKMSPEELKEFQKQQCIFCQIIDGKIPSKKVYEDDKCIAVMDINPAAIGHLLLMPKEHYAIMPQIPDEIIGHLFAITKHLSQSMLRKLKAEGTTVFVANGMVAGQRAQHFMLHIIPRREEDGLLDVPEHLVELELRENLALKIENRMNQLMGIKKERVRQKTLVEEPEEVMEEPEVEEKEVLEDKETAEPEETESEQPEEEVQEETKKDQKSAKKEKPKKGKKKAEPVEEEPEDEETDQEPEGEASLDDIANLFK